MGTLTVNSGGIPVTLECEIGQVSDGYHTFDELYDHRCLLFLALLRETRHYDEKYVETWKSRKHHDGSSFDGWFIAGMIFEGEHQISYHIPDKYWDLCRVQEEETAPKWDGHTSADVVERLAEWLK